MIDTREAYVARFKRKNCPPKSLAIWLWRRLPHLRWRN